MNKDIYAPPKSELDATPLQGQAEQIELAKRSSRFFAAMIDSLIGVAFAIPFILFAGPSLGYHFGQHQYPSDLYMVVSAFYGIIIFALVHGYLLHQHGQTIGKKLLGIRIVSKTDHKASASKIILLRYFPISFLPLIPIVGQFLPLLDILFIFRSDRRCLHDFIAGTRVIKAE